MMKPSPDLPAYRVPLPRPWLCAGLLVLSGCPALADPAATSVAAAASGIGGDPRSHLLALIGNAACDRDAQCHTVAIGQKSCGGPEAYLAWSDQRTDADTLNGAVARYNASQAAAQLGSGRMSNCLFVADPGAVCATAAAASGGSTPYRSCQLGGKPGRPRLTDR